MHFHQHFHTSTVGFGNNLCFVYSAVTYMNCLVAYKQHSRTIFVWLIGGAFRGAEIIASQAKIVCCLWENIWHNIRHIPTQWLCDSLYNMSRVCRKHVYWVVENVSARACYIHLSAVLHVSDWRDISWRSLFCSHVRVMFPLIHKPNHAAE